MNDTTDLPSPLLVFIAVMGGIALVCLAGLAVVSVAAWVVR